MDTIQFPAVVVPDLHEDVATMLVDPANIRLSEDIRDTDVLIDNIIAFEKEKGTDASWIYAVKEFTHEEKVRWILSLPDPGSQLLKEGSFVFPVTVYVTLMLKVAETVGGEALYEKKELEWKMEKCMPL